MSLSKREMLAASAGLFASLPWLIAGADASSGSPKHGHDMSMFPASWTGKEQIAFLAYPDFTALDLVGPHYMLGNLMGATVHIVANSREPVTSDMKLAIMPNSTLDECPRDLDVLCVPGGSNGTLAAMRDPQLIAFIKDRGSRARYVTSVCTGSLLLGAAGLLRGYKATSHWVTRDILRELGAEPVDERVVIDRNRITGAGVTAGLDMGLTMLAGMRDPLYAQSVQLLAEYDPAPPFQAGTPGKAPREAVGMMSAMFEGFTETARETAQAIARTW